MPNTPGDGEPFDRQLPIVAKSLIRSAARKIADARPGTKKTPSTELVLTAKEIYDARDGDPDKTAEAEFPVWADFVHPDGPERPLYRRRMGHDRAETELMTLYVTVSDLDALDPEFTAVEVTIRDYSDPSSPVTYMGDRTDYAKVLQALINAPHEGVQHGKKFLSFATTHQGKNTVNIPQDAVIAAVRACSPKRQRVLLDELDEQRSQERYLESESLVVKAMQEDASVDATLKRIDDALVGVDGASRPVLSPESTRALLSIAIHIGRNGRESVFEDKPRNVLRGPSKMECDIDLMLVQNARVISDLPSARGPLGD
jgi:hypothetical protein